MLFSFKLDGSPVSSDVWSSPRSRVSISCVQRLGLSFSGRSAKVAVSTKALEDLNSQLGALQEYVTMLREKADTA